MRPLHAIPALVALFALACSGVSPPSGPSNPGEPSTPKKPGPKAKPAVIGAPDACPREDRSGVPLTDSKAKSTVARKQARRRLEEMNEMCPDGACEGSLEWYYYDLRGTKQSSQLTMRVYNRHEKGDGPLPKHGNAKGKTVAGDGWKGTVLRQSKVRSCSLPCGTWDVPTYRPCILWDIRCEFDQPLSAGDSFGPWEQAQINCGIALEGAIRDVVPEFLRTGGIARSGGRRALPSSVATRCRGHR